MSLFFKLEKTTFVCSFHFNSFPFCSLVIISCIFILETKTSYHRSIGALIKSCLCYFYCLFQCKKEDFGIPRKSQIFCSYIKKQSPKLFLWIILLITKNWLVLFMYFKNFLFFSPPPQMACYFLLRTINTLSHSVISKQKIDIKYLGPLHLRIIILKDNGKSLNCYGVVFFFHHLFKSFKRLFKMLKSANLCMSSKTSYLVLFFNSCLKVYKK